MYHFLKKNVKTIIPKKSVVKNELLFIKVYTLFLLAKIKRVTFAQQNYALL